MSASRSSLFDTSAPALEVAEWAHPAVVDCGVQLVTLAPWTTPDAAVQGALDSASMVWVGGRKPCAVYAGETAA